MKKILLVICVAIATLNISACNVETSVSTSTGTNWSKSDNGITECGGTYNGTPYKAISMYIENVPSEEEVDSVLSGKISEGYDIALIFFEDGNLKLRVQVDTNKGYTDEDAEWIISELIRKSEAAGIYEDNMFVETVKEFMEDREE